MKLLRIFPSKTKATPNDDNVIINRMPELYDEADEIHISVAFTWDIPRAEKLYDFWKAVAPTKIGGPAIGTKGEEFIPGKYLKEGYLITSRGCNNRCWFCSVWKREGCLTELTIKEGWIITDDNLLACSENHIQSVFSMLRKQEQKPRFTGGLEAKLLTQERANQLKELSPDTMFFAYDTPDDLEPLINAGRLLFDAGFTKASHTLRAFVLIGYPKDSFDFALKRLQQTWDAGFMPMAMLYRDYESKFSHEWKKFQREWANPVITGFNCKKYDLSKIA
jgi:hypothetical protein